ncbi:MAG TPA: MOSC domain-containing protein [Dehalococcoidales bacterium]|nr:MOSC domain-containing protein [Dehalococcoidales bacterium]
MPSVVAVCKSRKKGTRKEAVAEGLFKEDYGLTGDAHADCLTNRQVSLLAMESIDKMQSLGLKLQPGDFAENITTEGMDLIHLPVGTRILVGDEVILEVTQIGKECHTACAIRRQVGECIMPEEGVFARVVHGGLVRPGDIVKTGENT